MACPSRKRSGRAIRDVVDTIHELYLLMNYSASFGMPLFFGLGKLLGK
jgi:hypothetical protein